jgi:energy-coupling factor transport system permease protein
MYSGGMGALTTVVDPVAPARIRPTDPRAVLLATGALIVTAVAGARTSISMLGLLAFVCAWHLVVTGSASATGSSLRRTAPFVLVIVVLNAIFGPGRALVSIGGVRLVADRGLANGVFFALRLALMLMSVSLLLVTVTPESLARGIYDVARRASRRSAEAIALFIFLSMGFVPLISDEFQRIRTAQAFRGAGLSGGLWHRIDSMRSWLVPLLLSAIHRSGQLAVAVELRQVRERLPQTVDPPRIRGADVALLVSTAAAIVAASM